MFSVFDLSSLSFILAHVGVALVWTFKVIFLWCEGEGFFLPPFY